MSNLLNPKEEDLRKYIEEHEKEWEFSDKLIYFGCLDTAKKVKLCDIDVKDVKGPIRTFLRNWGMMGRVIDRLDEEWQNKLIEAIKKNSKNLEKFRTLNLEKSYIDELRSQIIECYAAIKKIVGLGPTSVSKILHLICPNFFPLWDKSIRDKINKECKNLGRNSLGDSPAGYYKFMIEIQNFLKKHNSILSKLSKKSKKSKLKIADEFMWEVSRSKK